jgi:hypothetical protein
MEIVDAFTAGRVPTDDARQDAGKFALASKGIPRRDGMFLCIWGFLTELE